MTGMLSILVGDRKQLHQEGKINTTPSRSTVVYKIREKRTVRMAENTLPNSQDAAKY